MSIIDKVYGLRTYWWFEIFEDFSEVENLKSSISEYVCDFEKKFSSYHNESFISILNNERYIPSPDPELIHMLSIGVRLYDDSHGIFHIGLGHILEKLKNRPYITFESQDVQNLVKPIHDVILIENNEIILQSPSKIDLGGYSRGYVLDNIVTILREYGLTYFSVYANGNMYCTSDNGNPIEYSLKDPLNPSYTLSTVLLKDSALCATSPLEQRWGDFKWHTHYSYLINSQTLVRVTDTGTFVIAPSAVRAEGLSTALSIIGKDYDLSDSIAKQNNIEYLTIVYGNRIHLSERFDEYMKHPHSMNYSY